MTTDLEKSFKAKIRNIASEREIDPAILWQNIVLERFLVRVAKSSYVNHFVLKGGTLLSKIIPIERETKDLDFSLIGLENEIEKIKPIIHEIIRIDTDDGFRFENLSFGTLNHLQMLHPVTRVQMFGFFGKTRFKVLLDLGLGDYISPIERSIPLMASKKGALFESKIELKCYPVEFMLAEKIHAILERREETSRLNYPALKDRVSFFLDENQEWKYYL